VKAPATIARQILEVFQAAHTFCVVGHVRPDGDSIGSQLALALALRQQGKQVVCWGDDPMPQKLGFLDPDRWLRPPAARRTFDCVIAADCASFERLGRVRNHIARRRWLINIDHHASNTRYGNINWISGRSPSTGELVYRLLRSAGWEITPRLADCLYTAISTDTGSFQYPSTQPATLRIAGDLIRRGANLARIGTEVYESYPLARVRLVRHLYNTFRLAHDNRIAYFWLRRRDYARTGARPDDSEGLIDHIRAIEPVEVACMFEEIGPTLTRISLRSKNPALNVSEIATRFGGGGHAAAAGARVDGRPQTVQTRVIGAVKQALNGRP